MRAAAVFALVAVLAQESGAATALEVAVQDGAVTIRARDVALKEILDRLAGATGMRVVYEGAPPLAPITISLENAPPPLAVLRLLEGQGLGYAFSQDPHGSGVRTLLLFARAAGGGPAPVSSEPRGASSPEDAPTLAEEAGEGDAAATESAEVRPSQPLVPRAVSVPSPPRMPDAVSFPSRPLIPEAVSFPSQPRIPEAVSFPRR